jgi:uncharacterized membrane protein
MINGKQICGGSPINQITTGAYKVRATFFTPSNACFGFCQQVAGQQTLGTVDSGAFTINSTTSQSQIGLNTVFNKTSYMRGETISAMVTVTNNGNTSVDYPIGSSSCPDDVRLIIDNTDFYNYTTQANRACTMDYGYISLKPGQSYTRTFTGIVPTTAATGVRNVVTQLRNANYIENQIIATQQSSITIY